MRADANNYQVRAVSRALEILTSFTPEQPTFQLNELSERLKLHKSTLVRLLNCLVTEGFLEKTAEGYRLGIKAFEIGSKYYLTRLSVAQVARPYMTRLVEEWQLSANLALLDRDEIVYVDIIEPKQPLRVKFSIGSRLGVHCTALGKVLVSEMPEPTVEAILTHRGMQRYTPNTITTPGRFKECLVKVRSQGYALDHEEVIDGVRCVAAPIRDSSRQIISALSLSGPISVFTEEMVPKVVESLTKVTSEVSARLGYSFNP